MQPDHFSYTTDQAARTLGVTPGALCTQVRRTGNFRGITPTKLPNGRLLWPRSAILALADRYKADTKTLIDLRATNPWIESRGLLPSDPMAQILAIALCDPRDAASRDPQCHLDDTHALRAWNEAQAARLHAAKHRLSPEQWTDAKRLLALAVAVVVAAIEPAVLDQAVRDVLECRA